MKKAIQLSLILLCATFSIQASAQKEPNCSIGKSLSQMKEDYPKLRFTKTDEKGEQYMDGYPQNGIGAFFYFKDDKVIEESMIVQSQDNFPRIWFNSMNDTFRRNYSAVFEKLGDNAKHWCFSTYTAHLVYVSEGITNTAILLYQVGGSETGLKKADFIKRTKQ